MCGLIAVLSKNHGEVSYTIIEPDLITCREMLDTLKFRGPDEQRLVQFGPAVLGHTRLSIIDLSTGSQPIYNEDKTVAVLLNGEIYNFLELKNDLGKRAIIFLLNQIPKLSYICMRRWVKMFF